MMKVQHFVVFAACVSLAGCGTLGAGLNAQAEQLERALLDCKAQLGIPDNTQTEVTFDAGVVQARVLPFDQTSAQDAARINACANSVQVLDDGLVVVPLQSNAEPAIAVDIVAEDTRQVWNGLCDNGQTGMVGGSSYCLGGYR